MRILSNSEIAALLDEDGHAFLQAFHPEKNVAMVLSGLGEIIRLKDGQASHELRPRPAENAPPNTYSGNFGLDAFPLHTDMATWHVPPRYVVLRCCVGSEHVRTTLVDGKKILDSLGCGLLFRALVQPRRPVGGRRPLLRLLEKTNLGTIMRWDEKFLLAASKAGSLGIEKVRMSLASQPVIGAKLLHAGDTLIFDNWRMLHGREPIPPEGINRVVERAYLRSIGQ